MTTHHVILVTGACASLPLVIEIKRHTLRRLAAVAVFVLPAMAPALAQRPVTRAEAEAAALASGPRVALARADTAAAIARLLSARALPNPTFAAVYSKATPQKHLTLDLPLFDALRTRGLRVGQATASARAARLLFASERIAALVEVDTTYTRALAADARFRLSRQTARDADSLRRMTVSRRDAGDASDLDVDLSTVVAGQQLNVTTGDSLSYMSALLTVQTLMGLPADSVAIILADSLVLTGGDTSLTRRTLDNGAITIMVPPPLSTSGTAQGTAGGVSQSTGVEAVPAVTAAEANLQAADLGVSLQQKGAIVLPSLNVGVEFGDPSGGETGLLPLIGLSVPLPLFNRNQGPIAEARAERDKAQAQLSVARLEARQRLVEAVREREQLIAKIARDRNLVVRAQRVADRSLTAYREGASALPAVLEARRSAREVLGQYIDDLAALLTVNTELRALTQTTLAP
ncbi:TolC family protein [soil metagenome]